MTDHSRRTRFDGPLLAMTIFLSVTVFSNCKPEKKERFSDSVAFDAALSWVCAPQNFSESPEEYGGNTFRYTTDLIKGTGVKHIRERLSWTGTCPQPDSLALGYYLDNARYCRKNGIAISDVFHDAASYSHPDRALPRDLMAVYDYCRKCAVSFDRTLEMWEFWNEEDNLFAPEGAWDYAAALKAASLGWRAGGFKGLVSIGAFCLDDWNSYNETLFKNEPMPYMDVFNTHFYTAPESYGRRMKETRKFMERFGIGDMAVMLTECGTFQEGKATDQSVMEGFTMHSPDQENIQKEFCIKSQVLTRMEGVARNYFFVFGPYSEQGGTKDWGLLRRDGTPKPAVEAFQELIREVGDGVLAGEVKVEKENVRAFLFHMPGGKEKLMYWTVSQIDLNESEVGKWENDPVEASVTLANGESFPIVSNRFPQYATLPSTIPVERAPLPLGKAGAPPAPEKDLTIVMRADFNNEDCMMDGTKSRIEVSGDSVRFSLEVWNLDDNPKTGVLKNMAPGRIEGVPEKVELPAFGKVVVDLTYYPEGGSGQAVALQGEFDGKLTSAFCVPVLLSLSFKDLEEQCDMKELDWRNVKRWITNSSSPDEQITWDEKEQAVRIDTHWEIGSPGESDRWFFPQYRLNLPLESLEKAVMVTYEAKCSQDKVENDYSSARTYFVTNEKMTDVLVTPSSFEYDTRHVEVPESVKDKSVAIEFGGHPMGHRVSYWIKNVRIYNSRQ